MNHMLLPDGRSLAWRESGSGPPLVLLHGWGSSSAVFSGLSEQLPGQRLLALDLPGYGASSAAPSFALDAICADLEDWFAHLGLAGVALLGWSLGGMLAVQLAARAKVQLSRLLLIATTPRFVCGDDWPHGLPDAAVRALGRDFRRHPAATLAHFHAQQFRGDAAGAYHGDHLSLPLPDVAAALDGLETLRQADLRPLLPALALPALVVHGSRDAIIPVGAGHFLVANLPQGELCEIAGCGHAPFLSAPEEVGAALRAVLP